MTAANPAIANMLRKDRRVVAAALAAIVLLSWLYLFDMALGVPAGGGTMSMAAPAWTPVYFVAMFVMWTIMMVGMMVPSAAPMILLHAAVQRRHYPERGPYADAAQFTLGYLVVWAAFSLAATSAQWGLSEAAMLSPMMKGASPVFAGALFVAAGLWQLTPAKQACLKHCRSPVDFLVRHNRAGRFGPLLTGIHHGAYCVGCCWAIMILLFTLGVMNLLWVAVLMVFVLLEKVLPRGPLVGRVTGGLMLAGGAALMILG